MAVCRYTKKNYICTKLMTNSSEASLDSIKMLASVGFSHEQIAQKLNVTVEKVEALMAS